MLPWVGRNLFYNNADGSDDGWAGIAMAKPLALYYLIQKCNNHAPRIILFNGWANRLRWSKWLAQIHTVNEGRMRTQALISRIPHWHGHRAQPQPFPITLCCPFQAFPLPAQLQGGEGEATGSATLPITTKALIKLFDSKAGDCPMFLLREGGREAAAGCTSSGSAWVQTTSADVCWCLFWVGGCTPLLLSHCRLCITPPSSSPPSVLQPEWALQGANESHISPLLKKKKSSRYYIPAVKKIQECEKIYKKVFLQLLSAICLVAPPPIPPGNQCFSFYYSSFRGSLCIHKQKSVYISSHLPPLS